MKKIRRALLTLSGSPASHARLLMAGCVIFFLSTASARATQIAVIVNKNNTLTDISEHDLRKIFRKEKRFWDDGTEIYLFLPEVGSKEKEIALTAIYEMTGDELKRFWLTKLFRQEIASFPQTVPSENAAKIFVSQAKGSIGLIDAALLDDTVKALTIEGHAPDSPDYPLTDELSHASPI